MKQYKKIYDKVIFSFNYLMIYKQKVEEISKIRIIENGQNSRHNCRTIILKKTK